jgi:hypothetical protein
MKRPCIPLLSKRPSIYKKMVALMYLQVKHSNLLNLNSRDAGTFKIRFSANPWEELKCPS